MMKTTTPPSLFPMPAAVFAAVVALAAVAALPAVAQPGGGAVIGATAEANRALAEQPARGISRRVAARLDTVLAAQPETARVRYPDRHPAETLAFIGVEPGMTVMEALPGRGWYSKILIPYLGRKGELIGAAYPNEMMAKFDYYNAAQLEKRKTWAADWPEKARDWGRGRRKSAKLAAFMFGAMPDSMRGRADVALFIRAMHGAHRFENEGGYFTMALRDAHAALKPGGVLAVVQHEAAEDMPDDWARGANGYLKKSAVMEKITAAGFEFVAESAINENPADRPTTEDTVWRLPPTYRTSQDDPDARAKYAAIGESNRMTLKFRKPE